MERQLFVYSVSVSIDSADDTGDSLRGAIDKAIRSLDGVVNVTVTNDTILDGESIDGTEHG